MPTRSTSLDSSKSDRDRSEAQCYADWSEVGYRLRLLRKSRGWSLRDVANQAPISNAYVSQLETGAASEPSLTKLMTLCTLYGVTIDDLLSAA